MNDKFYANRIINECFSDDETVNHIKADDILCELLEELGFVKTVSAFKEVDKWYA